MSGQQNAFRRSERLASKQATRPSAAVQTKSATVTVHTNAAYGVNITPERSLMPVQLPDVPASTPSKHSRSASEPFALKSIEVSDRDSADALKGKQPMNVVGPGTIKSGDQVGSGTIKSGDQRPEPYGQPITAVSPVAGVLTNIVPAAAPVHTCDVNVVGPTSEDVVMPVKNLAG